MAQSKRPESKYVTGGRPVGKGETHEGALRGDEYDERNFYIRSVDNNGNRDSIRIDSGKCPPYLNAMIAKWVNDERTPYTSASDFFRDAASHRVHQLEKFAEDPSFDWGHLGIAEKRARLAREAADMQQQSEAFQQDFNTAVATGDYVWLGNLVEIGQLAIEKFREPYKSRIQAIIQPHLDGRITIAR